MLQLQTWQRILLVAILGAWAALFRLGNLDQVPPGLFIDEAQDGLDASAILRGERFPVVVEIGAIKGRSREALFHYLVAGFFRIAGTSVHSLRLTVALIGIATVITLFFLVEPILGPHLAFIASLLLAVCRWHVTVSRVAVRAVLVPLFVVLVLLACLHLARRRTLGAAILLGSVLGLGFYTYPAYWIVPPALALCLAVAVAAKRFRPTAADAKLALASLLALLAADVPLIHYALTRPDYFFARALEVATPVVGREAGILSLLANLRRVLLMFHLRGDPVPMYNIPGRPLLDPLTGIAFLLGLVWIIKRGRRRPVLSFALLAFWFLPLLPAVFSNFYASALRSVGSIPAICVISAIGLVAVSDWVASRWPRRGSLIATSLQSLVLLAVAGLNYHAYFFDFARNQEVAGSYSADIPQLFSLCARLAEQQDVYLSPYLYDAPAVRFLLLERPAPLHLLHRPEALVAPVTPLRDRVLVSDTPALNQVLMQLYPNHEIIGRYSVWGKHQGVIMKVDRRQIPSQLSAGQRAATEQAFQILLAERQARSLRW